MTRHADAAAAASRSWAQRVMSDFSDDRDGCRRGRGNGGCGPRRSRRAPCGSRRASTIAASDGRAYGPTGAPRWRSCVGRSVAGSLPHRTPSRRGADGGGPSTNVSSSTPARPIDCSAVTSANRRVGSVASWLSFLHRPSGKSWYRAHNASIVAGYVAHRHLAHEEHPLERFFMDVALVRVLFAECLLSAPRVALGRFGPAGRLLADPRWRGADFFLSLHNILPVRYPLDGLTVHQILEDENYIGRLIDYAVILPRVTAVYDRAAPTWRRRNSSRCSATARRCMRGRTRSATSGRRREHTARSGPSGG